MTEFTGVETAWLPEKIPAYFSMQVSEFLKLRA